MKTCLWFDIMSYILEQLPEMPCDYFDKSTPEEIVLIYEYLKGRNEL